MCRYCASMTLSCLQLLCQIKSHNNLPLSSTDWQRAGIPPPYISVLSCTQTTLTWPHAIVCVGLSYHILWPCMQLLSQAWVRCDRTNKISFILTSIFLWQKCLLFIFVYVKTFSMTHWYTNECIMHINTCQMAFDMHVALLLCIILASYREPFSAWRSLLACDWLVNQSLFGFLQSECVGTFICISFTFYFKL